MRSLLRLSLICFLALCAGCQSWEEECEVLCARFVNDCGFTAWASTAQCSAGCQEDLYRRSDAAEILSCYDAAVAPPTAAQAEARVDRALDAGLFDRMMAAGTYDRAGEIDRAVELGTCDLFEVVQCKVDAVQVEPRLPLVNR